jgi:BirA family transcriptional regulator, biotin operon repressor / biotin---[acetyl-CoA-carboxylase] ligase
MESVCKLQIIYLESVDSTQNYLKEALQTKSVYPPVAVLAKEQSQGKGSRGNAWISGYGNLYLSFALEKEMLPKDLKLESLSIYFAYLFKEVLSEYGSNVWLKWPNDFYIDDKKAGGIITNVVKDFLICGLGLNIKSAPEGFAGIDIDVELSKILEDYFTKLEKKMSWKYIFSKYKLEFYKSKKYFSHLNGESVSLQDSILLEDGSILCNGQRIFSIR